MATIAVGMMLSMSSCQFFRNLLGIVETVAGQDENYVDPWANLVNETEYNVKVEGNTVTYGSHSYTIVNEIDVNTTSFQRATASVTFSNIPSGYREFEAVYTNLLGQSRAGTAAMIPMAMEIYARSPETGKKCINLLCTAGAAGEFTTELRKKIIPSLPDQNNSYIQRYLPAALLKGAAPSNAYAPSSPYTVEMTMTSNGVKYNNLEAGEVTYMCIVTSGGWSSTPQRGIDLFQATGATLYKVFSCPSCYVQCQNIQGTWGGLK